MFMMHEASKNLIVTIVKKGWSDPVTRAARHAGAEGATILMGRGAGIHEKQTFLGLCIEPEKEVILTIVDPEQTDAVLSAITEAAQLDRSGMGIAFVVALDRVVGRVHKIDSLETDSN
jgi:nitrogen regulatory protein PII